MHLTPVRQAVFTKLTEAKGETVTNQTLFDTMIGAGATVPEVKVAISYIRKALKEAGSQDKIEVVWNKGYRLVKHEQAA
jgi:DNA-binding winged helix-turn-helix (wHTH) protein